MTPLPKRTAFILGTALFLTLASSVQAQVPVPTTPPSRPTRPITPKTPALPIPPQQPIVPQQPIPAPGQVADAWRAYIATEGNASVLVVEGIVANGGPGVVARVRETVPQGINPRILMLEVHLANLPGAYPRVIQPIPASFTKSNVRPNYYTSIQIRYANGVGGTGIDKIPVLPPVGRGK